MMSTWWLFWFGFMLLFLVTPVGYGWGYRGWGAPIPMYVQRRRAQIPGGPAGLHHRGWGWGGDLVWVALAIGLVWVVIGFWWQR